MDLLLVHASQEPNCKKIDHRSKIKAGYLKQVRFAKNVNQQLRGRTKEVDNNDKISAKRCAGYESV